MGAVMKFCEVRRSLTQPAEGKLLRKFPKGVNETERLLRAVRTFKDEFDRVTTRYEALHSGASAEKVTAKLREDIARLKKIRNVATNEQLTDILLITLPAVGFGGGLGVGAGVAGSMATASLTNPVANLLITAAAPTQGAVSILGTIGQLAVDRPEYKSGLSKYAIKRQNAIPFTVPFLEGIAKIASSGAAMKDAKEALKGIPKKDLAKFIELRKNQSTALDNLLDKLESHRSAMLHEEG